jgi:hypothetical protein
MPSRGHLQPVPGSAQGGCRLEARDLSSRGSPRRLTGDHSLDREPDRREGEPDRHPAGQEPRADPARDADVRATDRAHGAGRAAVDAARAAPRPPPGGRAARPRQCARRRRQGRLLPEVEPDGSARLGEPRDIGPDERWRARVVDRRRTERTDLPGRPHPPELPGHGRGVGAGEAPVRAGGAHGAPGSVGRPHRWQS